MRPIPIPAFNPGPLTGEGNLTWLVPGAATVLVDAGTGDLRHLEALERALGGGRLARVLVTHNHSDHASGASAIHHRMRGVRFAKAPWPERDGRYAVPWEALADGQVVEAGDTALEVIATPGHAPDHVCFWHRETRTLFGGDLAIAGTTVVIPAGAAGDLGAYLRSLDRVIALEPERILPAHGQVIDEPVRLLRTYLAHRRMRDEQVVAALDEGAHTVESVTARVYAGLSPALEPAAWESVTAHLRKLLAEGRVAHVEGFWSTV